MKPHLQFPGPVTAPARNGELVADPSRYDGAAIVLGALIETGGQNLPPYCARLLAEAPAAFDDLRHGMVAVEIRRLLRAGLPVHAASVAQAVTFDDRFAFVSQLLTSALDLGSAEAEAVELWREFKQQETRQCIAEAHDDLQTHSDKSVVIAENLVRTLGQIAAEEHREEIPKARAWLDVCPDASERQEAILVGPGNWLTRGSGLFIVAPTGAGKSTMDATLAFSWAIGRIALGLQPTRALRSLVIQAEDDDLDLSHMAQGIVSALAPSDAERELIRGNVKIVTERASTGETFLRLVDSLLREHPSDLVHVNPLSAFFGNDLNDQFCVARFFRNGLNPILARHAAGFVGIHHVPKPNKDRADWSGSDLAYSGAGSADLANWAREIITLRQTAPGLYEMTPTKRWRKLGWTDDDGRPNQPRLICHDQTGRMVWHDATPDFLEALGSKSYSAKSMTALVPAGGMDKKELIRLVEGNFAVSAKTARNYVADGTRVRKHQVGGKPVLCALFAEREVPRREVYPGQPGNRPVVWLTITPEWKELCP